MTSKSIYGCAPARGTDGRYHYVYRITNLVENKHYYGSRTSSVDPYLDLGTKYFSSAKTHKWIIDDQKSNPCNYRYKIIGCYQTRKLALHAEIKLHQMFNVSSSEDFYNAAKQSSTGFSTHGSRLISTMRCLDKEGNLIKIKRKEFDESLHTKLSCFKDKEGNLYYSTKEDPRYINGDIFGVTKNYSLSEETKLKIKETMLDIRKNGLSDETRKKLSISRLGKKKSKEEIERMIATKKSQNKTGERNANFRFYYHTPWGIVDTEYAFSAFISPGRLGHFCCHPDRIVISQVYSSCKKLQETFDKSSCVGKTYRELGFFRIPKEEISNYSDSKKLFLLDQFSNQSSDATQDTKKL